MSKLNLNNIFGKTESEESKDPDAQSHEGTSITNQDIDRVLETAGELNSIMVKNSANFILETICYFVTVMALAAVFLFYRIAPFDILMDMQSKPEVRNALGGVAPIQDLSFSIRLILGFIAIYSFLLARILHSLRRSNRRNLNIIRDLIRLRRRR